ncbi:flagellar hook-length control protein FliK [Buchnera aphidicola]|uniref:Flagellar hook-length control protein-like C-terminal domain-containing protein n=1 Tax=Buchnera aphidicola (Lipaphis pseudobrassicae) TaxID=1258543 RepID=A0A4D6Y7Y6_9GAMM|nr:flagellar hook-length control protein FliK [Buchnera aphidicola]QCI21970.1 hypothetical protein D9V70_00395 [Buchnera aphidicola (Lipaphis pseudobrassicae)]
MLKIIDNISLQKNTSCNFHIKNNIFDIDDDISKLSKSVFNKLKQCLVNQELEFENVSTEEKKKDNKNIICSNFVINNLLNIVIGKDKPLKFHSFKKTKNNILNKQEKKSTIQTKLNHINFLENINYVKVHLNQEKWPIEKTKILFDKKNFNKNEELKKNKLIKNFNVLKNLHIENIRNDYKQEKSIFDISEANEKKIKYVVNLVFFQDLKNYKNNTVYYKNTNKFEHLSNHINSLETLDFKQLAKSNMKSLFFYDSKNSIKWTKLINQKILLSIANKNNQVEFYLKPECLGSIHVKVNLKNGKNATLDFISNEKEIRVFLNNHISILQHSLMKHGITLDKVNIFSTLKNNKLKNYKNAFNLNKFQQIFDLHKKNTKVEIDPIDIYI